VRTSRLFNYLIGIAGALALTVVLVYAFMHPEPSDLASLMLLFGLTGSASAVIGYASHRLGWWRRVRSLTQTLVLGYVIAALLTLFNVWVTAQMMFLNEHDLTLATLLLLFAGAISVLFGYFLSGSLTQALRDVVRAAERVSEGDFSARVPVQGSDEVAQLAQTFNHMAARLQKADAEARALEAARRDLVAWASHDLRTPLASLRAMLDALSDGVVAEPETVARYLRQSQAEIARMSALIDDLFELAQMDAGNVALRFDSGSLADLISDTLEGFSARAQAKGVTLRGSVDPQIDPVWMASDKIGRVLQNLIENAIRHTPAGGHVDLHAEPRNGAVLVTLQDTGDGIPPEDLSHIFDRFYRGEKSRSREGFDSGGAGLGLAIAKGIVEAHGGRIWAESAPGRGATLKFTLPRQHPT
jgi:signal transduction histidine kinase